jgi:hypothetical protein
VINSLRDLPSVSWRLTVNEGTKTRPIGSALHARRHDGHEGNMADIERISVEDAHQKVTMNDALLVCAYEDDAKCKALNLDGSISLTSFQSKAASLPKTQEIIFYCA